MDWLQTRVREGNNVLHVNWAGLVCLFEAIIDFYLVNNMECRSVLIICSYMIYNDFCMLPNYMYIIVYNEREVMDIKKGITTPLLHHHPLPTTPHPHPHPPPKKKEKKRRKNGQFLIQSVLMLKLSGANQCLISSHLTPLSELLRITGWVHNAEVIKWQGPEIRSGFM